MSFRGRSRTKTESSRGLSTRTATRSSYGNRCFGTTRIRTPAPCKQSRCEISMASFYQVIYDEQCEICQAGVSWLKVLDHGKRIVAHPIDLQTLSRIHPDLNVDACLRELHVLTPEGRIVVGADAVIILARLFPETGL